MSRSEAMVRSVAYVHLSELAATLARNIDARNTRTDVQRADIVRRVAAARNGISLGWE